MGVPLRAPAQSPIPAVAGRQPKGRSRGGFQAFAGTRPDGEVAPIPVIRGALIEPAGSTRCGPLASSPPAGLHGKLKSSPEICPNALTGICSDPMLNTATN